MAVFGPASTEGAVSARSICNSHNVPHIDTRWDVSVATENNGSILFAPAPRHISYVVREIVTKYQWTKIAILYHDNDGEFTKTDIVPGVCVRVCVGV